ncbi:PEP-CTERM sorting domain-containing protein [Verrucomicrobiaceae bacterium N1E253]|uniref:PEP-CTERM sorting domain-containing protein n=1 Tax=Oceaniferula marina TaxID=2748318 RepID=A0A851GEC4_9BACT|nr:PEP-CTERM sorting domain-containing protein [Oceaniferula marina]NWK55776.1 PEP-CTERM sorting domain-containing protein [Oceaniferula marina]
MKKTSYTLYLFSVMLLGGGSLSAASTYTYDVSNVGPGNTLLSNDNWTGDDIANWKVGTFSGVGEYLRNSNDGDNTITRQNDANFSFTIDASTTSFSLETHGRFGVNGYFELGLVNSSGSLLVGLGADWYQQNRKCIILEGGRNYETGTSYPNNLDGVHAMKLDVDLLANSGNGSADLYFDGNLIIDDMALTLPDMTTATGLHFRSGTRYNGPGTIVITTIPEPSSTALLGIGGLALALRRRK